jgi:hypothetical protein
MRPGKKIVSGILFILFLVFFSLTNSGLSYSQAPASPYPLKFPWAGGLNSCQFCAIDLNLDGTDDLLIFDRHSNRKLTFINHGTLNSIDYTFAPEYALMLPEIHVWILTVGSAKCEVKSAKCEGRNAKGKAYGFHFAGC